MRVSAVLLFGMVVVGCATNQPPALSQGHVRQTENQTDKRDIPPIVTRAPVIPEPSAAPPLERYTVVVNDVPLRDLLFSLARDAQMNLDIDNSISGRVTLNAVQQTLHQILNRLSESAQIRYEIISDDTIVIQRDKPFFKSYRVSYLNVGRATETSVAVATQIGTTGQGAAGASGSQSQGDLNNNSQTLVTNTSNNQFWKTLETNIEAIIGAANKRNEPRADAEGDASGLDGFGGESGSAVSTDNSIQNDDDENAIIINREAGIVAVKASAAQHREVLEFLNEILFSAKRQVLIEATIAEVTLNDRFQAGIDWSMIQNGDVSAINSFTNPTGSNVIQNLIGANLNSAPSFFIRLTDSDVDGSRIDTTLRVLEQFGDVKIMSSPKLMALNNQTALLKVVDNIIYFNIEVDVTTNDEGLVTRTDYETNINTIPVGFVMSVTPFIDEHEEVTLNVRPTISRVIGQARDPNPALAQANVVSEVPIIQVREIESILSVRSGDIAVIGGLMQDNHSEIEARVPVLGALPIVGDLFKYRDNQYSKTELVIFIRPEVIREASLAGDLSAFGQYSPHKTSAPASRDLGGGRAARISLDADSGMVP
jgi:general secretion pathway protein D